MARARFRGADYNGRIRALIDLLESLPQGAEAVKAHMRIHGMRHYMAQHVRGGRQVDTIVDMTGQ